MGGFLWTDKVSPTAETPKAYGITHKPFAQRPFIPFPFGFFSLFGFLAACQKEIPEVRTPQKLDCDSSAPHEFALEPNCPESHRIEEIDLSSPNTGTYHLPEPKVAVEYIPVFLEVKFLPLQKVYKTET